MQTIGPASPSIRQGPPCPKPANRTLSLRLGVWSRRREPTACMSGPGRNFSEQAQVRLAVGFPGGSPADGGDLDRTKHDSFLRRDLLRFRHPALDDRGEILLEPTLNSWKCSLGSRERKCNTHEELESNGAPGHASGQVQCSPKVRKPSKTQTFSNVG